MSITHEEARRLIQFKADEALKEIDNNLLEAHLGSCTECQHYEAGLNELESTLRPLMQRKWNRQPLPHPAGRAIMGVPKKFASNIFFATRILAMGLICIAFLFNIWQFTKPGRPRPIPPVASIPLIPTPSLQSTQTQISDQNCESTLYTVQSTDTLESIAHNFSITVEEILRANNIKTATLNPSMKLAIPICDITPAGTQNLVKTTFTPLLVGSTITPVNSPTQ
jgi:hypothetical protein